MPYVYRYINIEKEEVVYIGKVVKYQDQYAHPIELRHRQHKRDEWYEENGGDKNLLLQYIECETPADADIMETYLIGQYYDTEQLANKDKARWGCPTVKVDFGKKMIWSNFTARDFSSDLKGLNNSTKHSLSDSIIFIVQKTEEEICKGKMPDPSVGDFVKDSVQFLVNEMAKLKKCNGLYWMTNEFKKGESE